MSKALDSILRFPVDDWKRQRNISIANEGPPPVIPDDPDYFGDGEFGPDEPEHPYPYFVCPICKGRGATLVDGDDGPEFCCLDCTKATLPIPTPPPRRAG